MAWRWRSSSCEVTTSVPRYLRFVVTMRYEGGCCVFRNSCYIVLITEAPWSPNDEDQDALPYSGTSASLLPSHEMSNQFCLQLLFSCRANCWVLTQIAQAPRGWVCPKELEPPERQQIRTSHGCLAASSSGASFDSTAGSAISGASKLPRWGACHFWASITKHRRALPPCCRLIWHLRKK